MVRVCRKDITNTCGFHVCPVAINFVYRCCFAIMIKSLDTVVPLSPQYICEVPRCSNNAEVNQCPLCFYLKWWLVAYNFGFISKVKNGLSYNFAHYNYDYNDHIFSVHHQNKSLVKICEETKDYSTIATEVEKRRLLLQLIVGLVEVILCM